MSGAPQARWSGVRLLRDRIFWTSCVLAFLLIAAPTVAVLANVFDQAAPDLGVHLLSEISNATGGGLQNAILGTLLLLLGVLVVAGVAGVGAGIYLAEYSPPRLGGSLRFGSEVLAGSPSIVIGYVAYMSLVVGLHWQFSLAAAVIALSVLVLPYIVKTTEVAFRQVPTSLREGAAALGVSRSRAVWSVLLPTAVPGILSGLVVALAISTGETAPLLLTAGYINANPTFQLTHRAVPYLTYVTYTDISLPGNQAHAQGAAAAAITLVILLVLIFVGRMIGSRSRRRIRGLGV